MSLTSFQLQFAAADGTWAIMPEDPGAHPAAVGRRGEEDWLQEQASGTKQDGSQAKGSMIHEV